MKNKQTINMFQIPPLMVFEYDGDMNKLLEYVSNIEYRDSTGNIKSKSDYILDEKELSVLKKFCLESVQEYISDVLGISDEIEIHQSWVNVNKPGQNHPEHYHGNSFISGVFYLSSDQEEGSPITFKSELHKSNFSILTVPEDPFAKYYPSVAASFNYPSIPGELILFSSTTTHLVPTNKSDEVRVSLSFNTYPKIPFGSKVGLTYVRG
tara:strand:+ start:838 stop:1464 length:627 start_codon:yes stop_codon:yes gene_type:complete